MVWLPVFRIFNMCTDVDACDCTRGRYSHRKRVRTGNLSSCTVCASQIFPSIDWVAEVILALVRFSINRLSGRGHSWEERQGQNCISVLSKALAGRVGGWGGVTDLWISIKTNISESDLWVCQILRARLIMLKTEKAFKYFTLQTTNSVSILFYRNPSSHLQSRDWRGGTLRPASGLEGTPHRALQIQEDHLRHWDLGAQHMDVAPPGIQPAHSQLQGVHAVPHWGLCVQSAGRGWQGAEWAVVPCLLLQDERWDWGLLRFVCRLAAALMRVLILRDVCRGCFLLLTQFCVTLYVFICIYAFIYFLLIIYVLPMYLSGFSYLLFDLSPWYDLDGWPDAFFWFYMYIYISVDYVFFLFHIQLLFL